MSVRPKRELGQHWLVDENILQVIGRLAEIGPEDVVLEIGPGLGVLTVFLAGRARVVHAVEVDRSLEASLRERLAGAENVELVFGDALDLLGADFAPAPTKLVANLPYNVATPIVMESLAALPTVQLWCVMVQREVADRFLAGARDEGLRRGLGRAPARHRAQRVPSGRAHLLPAAPECRLCPGRLPADAGLGRRHG